MENEGVKMENKLTTDDINRVDKAWENFVQKRELYLLNKISEMEVDRAKREYEELAYEYWKKLREVVNGRRRI